MNETHHFGFFDKLGYGLGQSAEGIKNNAFEIFLFFYYTQVLGLTGTLAGLALFLALCVDAITDPLVGLLSDGMRTRWGRRHPLMYASAMPLGICFFMLFSPPESLTQLQLFTWLSTFAIAVRVCITFFQVPHLALGAELSDDYAERSSIVGFRTAFSTLGGLLLVIIAFSVFFKPTDQFVNGQLNPQGYAGFGLFFAVVMAVAIILTALATHRHIPHVIPPQLSHQSIGLKSFIAEVKSILSTRPYRILFVGVILFSVMRGVQSILGLHAATYFWQLTTEQIQLVTLAIVLGLLLGIPFAKPLSSRFDKKWIFVVGIAWAVVFHVVPIVLRLNGLLPEENTSELVAFLVVASMLGGGGAVQALVAAGSMVADVADLHRYHSGHHSEGLLFGGLSFAGKTASGLGHIVAGISIDLIAFPTDLAPGLVPRQTLTHLALLYGPGVSLIGISAMVVFVQYSLPRAHLETILSSGEGER